MEDLRIIKSIVITTDSSLNQFDGKVLFPSQLDKANKAIEKMGLPKP